MSRIIDSLARRAALRKQEGPPPCGCELPAGRKVAVDKPPLASRKRRIDLRGAVLPIVAIALWWAISEVHLVKSGLLVSPAEVLRTAWQQIVSGALVRALSASLAREASGFAIGTVRVPIVSAAVLFDLLTAGDKNWGRFPPYRELGYSAASNAALDFALGSVGAGTGATTDRKSVV